MIKLFNVSKKYCKRLWALRDVSFEVPQGASLLLRGDSGAGKTTLLRMIYGLERPDEGHIMVAGRNIFRLRRSSLPFLRRQIGFAFQDLKLMEHRSIVENVVYPLYMRGVWGKKAKRRAVKACALVGLEAGLQRRCGVLARGEQQQVVLARAVVAEPALLLADEPTAHLDAALTASVLNLLTRINSRGTTVVLATGDRLVAGGFQASQVVQLNGGALVGAQSSNQDPSAKNPKAASEDNDPADHGLAAQPSNPSQPQDGRRCEPRRSVMD